MANDTVYYFGTSLTSAGHFFWELSNDRLERTNISFQHLSFNPEEYPIHPKGQYSWFQDGYCAFYNTDDYTIFAITGSCSDPRKGSKSVFFTRPGLTFQQMWESLCDYKVFRDMVAKMPFRIQTERIP